jgi:glucose-1-phosphate adenylyltransferase
VDGGSVERSLIAPAARVAGSVSRSVLGRGVVVEAGAVVRESVLLPGAVVRSGARVERAVVDDEVVVERDVVVGEEAGEIALVGLRASVTAAVPGGGRFPVVDDD